MKSVASAARSEPRGARTRVFRRELLPVPTVYYSREQVNLLGRGEWRSALCPFHPDRHPSLRIHVASGAFRCMACGEKGGDVLAFQMKRHGQQFVDAAKALGAWDEVRP